MCHSRGLNNRINKLHERALRMVYKDYTSSFHELLTKDNSVTIHENNIQKLVTEIFKVKIGEAPEIMQEIFQFKENHYNMRCNDKILRDNVKTTHYGLETLSTLGSKLWDLLPSSYKEIESLIEFKRKIKTWKPKQCPCRLCMRYVKNIGFI